jgi:hypothetical protein
MASMDSKDAILFEVDAPGVHPNNVRTSAFLEAAAAYFALLEQAAKAAGRDLRIFGVQVRDKCAAVEAQTTSLDDAIASAHDAQSILARDEPPYGYHTLVSRMRVAMLVLDGHRARSHVGTSILDLPLSRNERSRAPFGTISLRAKLLRIGGAEPRARFSAIGEDEFTLDLSGEQMAQRLAPNLYREADIVANVSRNEVGDIDGGRLIEFEPVEDLEPEQSSSRMRAWFATNSIDWDLALELERGDD